jgi:2-octaprenyl-6-methoxyphenol hydroxylase
MVAAPARLAEVSRQPGHVEAALEDGRRIRARLLIAADGARSKLRRDAGIAAAEFAYGQTGIVCTVAHELPHGGVAHEHFLPAGPFAMLPMTDHEGRHRSSIVWTERNARVSALLALDDADFSAEIEQRFGDSLGRIAVLGGRWSYPLRLIHAARYADHRLALVGDAAHAIHPIAGQGLNLGLRDVAALAEVIADAWRLGLDIGATDVLEDYQRWRRVDSLLLITVTDSLNRLFSNDLAPLRLARDLGLAAVDRLPPLKRLFMRHAMGAAGPRPRLLRGEPL